MGGSWSTPAASACRTAARVPTGRCSAPGLTLRRTMFDIDAACARIAAESGYPGAADWPDYFVRARATDAEALAVFGPRDGRS